jgi:hypothetical protein
MIKAVHRCFMMENLCLVKLFDLGLAEPSNSAITW